MQSIAQAPARPASCIAHLCSARLLAVFGMLAMLYGGAAIAANPEFTKAPAPAWVEPVALPADYVVPSDQVSGGVYYLLVDSQTRLEAQGKVSFRRYAIRTLSAEGVQESANIEIPFDPSYQALTLHSIDVIRDGRTIDKLPGAAVRILQREKDLELLIYDGRKTASVFLDDVRVGDVIDYSFSVSGVNPVFGNRHFGGFQLQWGAPLELLSARLLVPDGRPLTLHSRNGAALPKPVARDGYQEYRVRLGKRPALIVEKDAPGWFDPYPAIEWSEFADWKAVARWAAPLYRHQGPLSPALQAEIARIRGAGLDEAGQLRAVLRFVQGEVRYLGVEVGAGSHAPRMPNLVFERRFGDCKDKALLTIVLLEALGIEARAALVNTSELRGVRDAAPRPDAFDHVIVRARLDGKTYWLDPTRKVQSGTLATLFQPDFGVALIVDPTTTALVPMRVPASSAAVKTVHAVLDASAGLDAPVRYTVTTRAKGSSAEALRNTLASSNLEALQNTYLNYYAGYYPAISVAAPMSSEDDAANNTLTTTEHYVIRDFWVQSKTEPQRIASIHAPEVADLLEASPSSIRRAPLSVAHPFDLTLTTEVLLPEAWPITPETLRVDDAAFKFERVVSAGATRLVLVDRYRSLMDHVPARRAAAHAGNLSRARDTLGYSLSIDSPGSVAASGSLMDRFNWPLAALALALLAGFAYGARRLYRYDPPADPHPPTDPRLAGFGGWLILVIIGLVVLPFRVVKTAIESAPAFAADNWARLTVHGGADYHWLWAPALLFDLALLLAQMVGLALLLMLFFTKRRSTPRVYVGFVLLSLAGAAVGMFGMTRLPGVVATSEDWTDLARGVVSAAIWCPYWLVSKRVKATFRRGWGEATYSSSSST